MCDSGQTAATAARTQDESRLTAAGARKLRWDITSPARSHNTWQHKNRNCLHTPQPKQQASIIPPSLTAASSGGVNSIRHVPKIQLQLHHLLHTAHTSLLTLQSVNPLSAGSVTSICHVPKVKLQLHNLLHNRLGCIQLGGGLRQCLVCLLLQLIHICAKIGVAPPAGFLRVGGGGSRGRRGSRRW